MAELTQQEHEQLREMTEVAWVNACMAKEGDAAAAMCTEDVDYMPADLPLLKGRAAVSDFLNEFPELVAFHQKLVSVEGDTSLAVARVTFGGSFVVDGQELSAVGKGLATATMDSGSWLFSAVCWNWDAPPAPSE